MIGTESKLWQLLKAKAGDSAKQLYTRIETSTIDGVSDVEYVALPWHGWVELKTATWPRKSKPFSLHAPFTLAQCSWLLRHHAPRHNLRSWVLLGIIGARTWRGFVLFPAPTTTHLLHKSRGPAVEWLMARKGIKHCLFMEDVVRIIKEESRNG